MEEERMTFRELFCEKHGIEPGDFEVEVLRETLYPTASMLYFVLRIFLPDCFSPDLKFIGDLGDCRSPREAREVFDEFSSHRDKESFVRRVFKFRISKKEALRISARTFPAKAMPSLRSPRRQNIRTH